VTNWVGQGVVGFALAAVLVLPGCSGGDESANRPALAPAAGSGDVTTATGDTTGSTNVENAAVDQDLVSPAFMGDPDSGYCLAARNYAADITEVAGTDQAQINQAQINQAQTRVELTYVSAAEPVVPSDIAEQFARYAPVARQAAAEFELSKWDLERLLTIGTAPTLEFLDGSNADVAELTTYDQEVCLIGTPPVVERDFTAADPALCAALTPMTLARSTIEIDGGTEPSMRLLAAAWATIASSAPRGGPAGLAEDVVAYTSWMRDRATPVLASFGTDLRRVIREGTADQRRVVSGWDSEIRDAAGRVERYSLDRCTLDTTAEPNR